MEKLRMIIVAFFMMQFNALFSQNWVGEFQLDGKIEDVESGKIILSYNYLVDSTYQLHQDTTNIVHGKFHFQGTIDEPVTATLHINDLQLNLVLEANRMKVSFTTHHLEDYTLTGSLTNDEAKRISHEFSRLGDTLSLLRNKIETDSLSEDALSRLSDRKDSIALQRQRVYVDFAKVNPRSFMILKYLSFFSPSWLSLEEAQALYDNFTEEQKKSPSAKFVAQMIRNKKESQTGEKAYDFQFFTKDSVEMHLSDFQKKNYVLLDFGASWCKPCVANIPYIRSCYDKYKDKGMVVIEISNDSSEETWKNSIEKNGTSDWYHVLDKPTFVSNDLRSLNRIYNIFCYPHYLLIDRNGFIVGRWGGMTDKDKKEFEECLEKLSNES